jgi:competence ComEA-like helix-hairpin-helix protein
MLTTDEARALAILSALVALGAVLGWVDARHPRFLHLTLGDSLALGVSVPETPAAPASDNRVAANPPRADTTGVRPPAEGGAYDLEGRLDVNRATAEELETLPGVGPKTAARIVEDRGRRGRFRTTRDLGRVKGIGPKTLARLLPRIVAGPAMRAGGR